MIISLEEWRGILVEYGDRAANPGGVGPTLLGYLWRLVRRVAPGFPAWSTAESRGDFWTEPDFEVVRRDFVTRFLLPKRQDGSKGQGDAGQLEYAVNKVDETPDTATREGAVHFENLLRSQLRRHLGKVKRANRDAATAKQERGALARVLRAAATDAARPLYRYTTEDGPVWAAEVGRLLAEPPPPGAQPPDLAELTAAAAAVKPAAMREALRALLEGGAVLTAAGLEAACRAAHADERARAEARRAFTDALDKLTTDVRRPLYVRCGPRGAWDTWYSRLRFPGDALDSQAESAEPERDEVAHLAVLCAHWVSEEWRGQRERGQETYEPSEELLKRLVAETAASCPRFLSTTVGEVLERALLSLGLIGFLYRERERESDPREAWDSAEAGPDSAMAFAATEPEAGPREAAVPQQVAPGDDAGDLGLWEPAVVYETVMRARPHALALDVPPDCERLVDLAAARLVAQLSPRERFWGALGSLGYSQAEIAGAAGLPHHQNADDWRRRFTCKTEKFFAVDHDFCGREELLGLKKAVTREVFARLRCELGLRGEGR